MHFPPALYTYITEELKKSVVIVLNKVDLAPPSLVVAWQHYFKQQFPLVDVVCFSSFPKSREEIEAFSDKVGKGSLIYLELIYTMFFNMSCFDI